MRDAANEIKAARKRESWERYERGFARMMAKLKPEHDPEVEAAAARRLAEEEEAIARKYDMLPDWSADQYSKDFYKELARRRR